MTVSITGSFLKIDVLKIGSLCLQRIYNFINTEAVVQRYSLKKVFLEISQNSQENTCVIVSFLIKLQAWACKFIKKETLAQIFSCEFCGVSENTFFKEHLWWLLLLIFNFLHVPTILSTFSKKSFQNFQNIASFSENDTEYT